MLSQNLLNPLARLANIGKVFIVVDQILKGIIVRSEDRLVRVSVHLADNLSVLVEKIRETFQLWLRVEKVPDAHVHEHEWLVDYVQNAISDGNVGQC